MNKIKVSIKVLCYNQEKYIRETLDSILNQEHPYTYEVIVCDDASQDSTPQIVAEYAARHKEIVPVLRKRNIGLIANYFDAVSRCRGEYIMGCAGDDYWLPGKVAKQVEYMDQHPEVGLCYGDATEINELGIKIRVIEGKENYSFEHFLISNIVPACSICQRHSVLTKYIEEIAPIKKPWKMEDYPMLLWFSVNSKIVYIKGECVVYRVLLNSASHFDKTKYKKWLSFRENVFSIKTFYIEKYPPKNLKIKRKISNIYVMELMEYRTFSNKAIKYELNNILDSIPYMNKSVRKCFKLANKYFFLNKIFACLYKINYLKNRILTHS